MDNDILDKVAVFVTDFSINQIPESVIYHNLAFTQRLVAAVKEIASKENLSEKETTLLLITAWIFGTGYSNATSLKGEEIIYGSIENTKQASEEFLHKILSKEEVSKVFQILENTKAPKKPKTKLDFVFADALAMDFAREKGKKYLKKMYEERLIFNAASVENKKWNDALIEVLTAHTFYTDYGKTVLEARKQELKNSLKETEVVKELKVLPNDAIKKGLNISDKELKALKKSLGKSSKIDQRAIQTLFRNTSKNHYTLNAMVDRKANIMISINAIINSLIIGGILGTSIKMPDPNLIPIFILMLASLISIFYAILSIKPDKTHGEFTEEEIRSKQGNLLYFGNFHNMSFRDYEWAVLEMLNDKDYLYSSLIRDIYYLGEKLHRKHANIRKSLTIFLIGIGFSVTSFLILKLFF